MHMLAFAFNADLAPLCIFIHQQRETLGYCDGPALVNSKRLYGKMGGRALPPNGRRRKAPASTPKALPSLLVALHGEGELRLI